VGNAFLAAALALVTAAPALAAPAPRDPGALQQEVVQLAAAAGAEIGVALIELGGEAPVTWSYNGDLQFIAASTYKLPLLMAEAQLTATGAVRDWWTKEDAARFDAEAKKFGAPVLVEWGTEPNGKWFSWNGKWNGGAKEGPARYIAAWRHIVDVNLFGSLQLTKSVIPVMKDQGGGSIVFVNSMIIRKILPLQGGYATSKGALMTAAQVLAKELGPHKIRVNSINPGMVETEGTHTSGILGTDFQKQLEAQTPLGRIAQPEEVALRKAQAISAEPAEAA